MKVLIVSNDSAGAEIISSWVRLHSNNTYDFILGPPAEKIFKRKLLLITNNSSDNLENLIQDFDLVITGTSQTSDLEKRAIFLSKKYNIKVISILDYWVNFASRFIFNNDLIYPDEIWVTDKYSLANAKEELTGANILLKNNPYIEELLLNKISKSIDRIGVNILYVCQPYNEDNLTDIEALDYFFSTVIKLKKITKRVKLRLHPLEEISKYQDLINKYKNVLHITQSYNSILSDDLNWSDIVVGMHAQALAVAVEFGLNAFYCIPSHGKKCVLPHEEITNFSEYIKLKKI